MLVLREVNKIELNKGSLMAEGLFNLSDDTNVSLWFDTETKDRLMKLNDAEFYHQAKDIIKESNLD